MPEVGGALGKVLVPPRTPPPGIKGCGGLDTPGGPLGDESLKLLPLPPNVGKPLPGGKVFGWAEDVGGGAVEPGG